MSKEFVVTSIEEMCSLMCGNRPIREPDKATSKKKSGSFKPVFDEAMRRLENEGSSRRKDNI